MEANYKRMIHRMREKEQATYRRRPKKGEKWFLYILRCKDKSFYTGITKDLDARLKKHNSGTASRYTRIRRPVEIIYREICGTHSQALIRECAVKALAKKQKQKLVESGKPLG